MEAGSAEAEPESETALGKRGNEDAGADPIVVPAAGATAVANGAEFGVGSAGPATAAAKPRRPLFARKGVYFSWNRDPVTGLICIQSGPRG